MSDQSSRFPYGKSRRRLPTSRSQGHRTGSTDTARASSSGKTDARSNGHGKKWNANSRSTQRSNARTISNASRRSGPGRFRRHSEIQTRPGQAPEPPQPMPASRPHESIRPRRRPIGIPALVEQRRDERRTKGLARPVGVARRQPSRKRRRSCSSPESPLGFVYRTMLPRGPSVTTRIETCQPTSSRSSSVSHSIRLQQRTSIDAANRDIGKSRSSMLRIAGAKSRTPAPGHFQRGCRQLVRQRGHDAKVACSLGKRCKRCRLDCRMAASKADRQLVAEFAARDQERPVGRMIGHSDRVVRDSAPLKPF